MVVIYCIEDINDLKYIGSTTQTLGKRLTGHKQDAKRCKKGSRNCSSKELNLYNCIIYELETCSEEERSERESYHINNTECVNVRDLNGKKRKPEYMKKYSKDNEEKLRLYRREYYMRNKQKKLNAV